MHCFNLVNLIIFALVDFSNGQLDLSQTAIHIFIQFPKHFNRLLDPFLPLDYDKHYRAVWHWFRRWWENCVFNCTLAWDAFFQFIDNPTARLSNWHCWWAILFVSISIFIWAMPALTTASLVTRGWWWKTGGCRCCMRRPICGCGLTATFSLFKCTINEY